MSETINKTITNILNKLNISEKLIPIIVDIIILALILLISFIVYLISKYIIVKVITRIVKNTKNKWDNIFMDNKVIHRLAYLLPGVIVHIGAPLIPSFQKYIEPITLIYIIFVILATLMSILDALNEIYEKSYAEANQRPIKGFIQIVKIVLFIIAIIIVISKLIGESPIILLGGLGAMSAVTLLIFQDSIKGLVAGVQMASNDMVRIGDWIEMPKYGADGDVIDISLNVVKVENFDKTITTIPAYAMVSDSFKNWRGMQTSGGRRIKRSLNIDMSSIKFCSDELLQKLEKITIIKKYLNERKEEIEKFNKKNKVNTDVPINGRRLTNIGVFRVYIKEYLLNHPGIHKDMIIMTRQLSPEREGIPLEIYAFANTTKWEIYENIQSDIFDHLTAAISYFELKIFQDPAGSDIRNIHN